MNVLLYYASEWKKSKLKIDSHEHEFLEFSGSFLKLQKMIDENKIQFIFLIGFKEEQKTINDLKKLVKSYPLIQISIFTPNPKSDFLLECMKIGLTEIFTQLNKNSILEIIEKFQKKIEVSQKSRALRQYTLGFLSAKGGDGSSYLAANFAAQLAKNPMLKVLLIDLSLPYGDLDMFVTNKKNSYDFVDFTNAIDRLDDGLVESMVHKLNPNLHLIASPRDYEKVTSISIDNIVPLIDQLKSSYDYLIFDIGSTIDPMIISIVEKLNHLYLVLTKSLPSVRQASQKIDLFESVGIPEESLSLIINNKNEIFDLNLSNIESGLNKSIRWEVPYDSLYAQDSLLKGKPSVDINHKTSFSMFIETWTEDLLGSKTEKKKKNSIWQRLKKTPKK